MYKFEISRVRVDLGGEVFVDAMLDAEVDGRWKDPSLNNLCTRMRDYINLQQGQVVELDKTQMKFDTCDLTIDGKFTREDDQEINADDISFIEKFFEI